jgi:peroxiredoxin
VSNAALLTLSRRALVRASLLTAGSLVACAPAVLPPSSPSPLLGSPLPAFSGITLNGSEFDSNSSRGLVLAVAFFDSAGNSGDRDLDAAGALYSDHPDLVLVGVALDQSIEDVRAQVTRHSLHFPLLHDPDRHVAERLGVSQPRTVLAVDRRGVLRWVGDAGNPAKVRAAAEALLGESA